jgi:hypothetical protein
LRWARGVVNWETLDCGDMSRFGERTRLACWFRRRAETIFIERAMGPQVCLAFKKFAIASRERSPNGRFAPSIDKRA